LRATSLFISSALAITLLAGGSLAVESQDSRAGGLPAPAVTSAADGILTAFQDHPLVGVGDFHGLAQEEDFYASLVRNKRFAREVGNVVVEFGDAAQQDTIDRYLSGEYVPYEQLRKVWEDNVGWIPTVTALGYIDFYAQVRAVNLGLPPDQRIHVWLGDPPIDWSKIKTQKDFLALLDQRNTYPAEIINSQILAKKRKALVIYGAFHFYGARSLRTLVEDHQPGAFFLVTPYTGFEEKTCSDALEQTTRDWPLPALAAPVRGSRLEVPLSASGCHVLPLGPNPSEAEKQNREDSENQASGVSGNALLYLGPATSLTQSAHSPDTYIDLDFSKEIDRRNMIRFGQSPASFANWKAHDSPTFLHSYGDAKQPSQK
jgi:hypothetical protein